MKTGGNQRQHDARRQVETHFDFLNEFDETTKNPRQHETEKPKKQSKSDRKPSCLRDKTFRQFFQIDRQLNTQRRNPNRPKTSGHSNLNKDERKPDTTQRTQGETRLDVLNDFYHTARKTRQRETRKHRKHPKLRAKTFLPPG